MGDRKLIGRYLTSRLEFARAVAPVLAIIVVGKSFRADDPHVFLSKLGVVIIGVVVVSWGLARLYATELYVDGFRGFTTGGGRPFVKWSDLTRVEWLDNGTAIGLSTAELDARIPGGLARDRRFLATLKELLGNTHELVRLLERGP